MKTPTTPSNKPTPTDCGGSPEGDPMRSSSQATQSDSTDGGGLNTHNVAVTKAKRCRVYAAVRIVDFQLKALAPVDNDDPQGEQDWADVSGSTTLSTDREAMYQLARLHDGLLMTTTGLPGGRAMMGLQERAKVMSEGAATPF